MQVNQNIQLRMQAYKNKILEKLDSVPKSITPIFKDSCTASSQAALFCLTGQARTVPDLLRDADCIGSTLTPDLIARVAAQKGDSILLFDIGDHKFCVLCVFEADFSSKKFEIIQSNQDTFSTNHHTGTVGKSFTLREWLLQKQELVDIPYLGVAMDQADFTAFCEKLVAADEASKYEALFGVAFKKPAKKGRFINIPI